MIRTMLTTIDNPHSPFENWAAWLSYDLACGYNTSGFLARIVNASSDLSDVDYDFAVTTAIDEIIRENVTGLYKKVTLEVTNDTTTEQS